MDNSSKAFIMGASVLLFIIALSIGVYTYTVLMETTDSILTTSEQYAKTAEYFTTENKDTTRTISTAEIIMSIQNLKDIDYTYNTIVVDGFAYTKENVENNNVIQKIETLISRDKKYFIVSQDWNNMKITYEEI